MRRSPTAGPGRAAEALESPRRYLVVVVPAGDLVAPGRPVSRIVPAERCGMDREGPPRLDSALEPDRVRTPVGKDVDALDAERRRGRCRRVHQAELGLDPSRTPRVEPRPV